MSQRKRILLIEDEEEIAALIKLQAEVREYKLHVEVDGINGFRAAQREKPDLIILDIYLPGQNGFDVVRKIKNSSELRNIPVMILSSKKEEIDVVLGLELGADDYMTKPFSMKIFFAKIKAMLRRNRENERISKNIKFGNFTLEVDKYVLRNGDMEVPVTLSEFGILRRLLTNKGKVLTRNQLLDDVNNDDAFIVDRNIDVHIASLRKKLGNQPNLIETVRGVGYRFKELGL